MAWLFMRRTRRWKLGSTVHASIDWEQRFSTCSNIRENISYQGLIHAAYGYDNVNFI